MELESPQWLALQNRHDDALRMLFRLRLSTTNVHSGFTVMQYLLTLPELDRIEKNLQIASRPLFSRLGADILIIACLLMVFQQVYPLSFVSDISGNWYVCCDNIP